VPGCLGGYFVPTRQDQLKDDKRECKELAGFKIDPAFLLYSSGVKVLPISDICPFSAKFLILSVIVCRGIPTTSAICSCV